MPIVFLVMTNLNKIAHKNLEEENIFNRKFLLWHTSASRIDKGLLLTWTFPSLQVFVFFLSALKTLSAKNYVWCNFEK